MFPQIRRTCEAFSSINLRWLNDHTAIRKILRVTKFWNLRNIDHYMRPVILCYKKQFLKQRWNNVIRKANLAICSFRRLEFIHPYLLSKYFPSNLCIVLIQQVYVWWNYLLSPMSTCITYTLSHVSEFSRTIIGPLALKPYLDHLQQLM